MQTIEKIEQCSYCDGRGWREITEFDGGHRTELGKRGCTDCGGKGEIYHSWHIKHLRKYGLSPHTSAPFREGSGKLRTFYQVTSENCKSKSCHGGCQFCEQGKYLSYVRSEPYVAASGCYLTTACVEHKGLSDDCTQLQTLRRFRDSYIRSRTDGEQILNRYYTLAPEIVTAIQASPAREEHLNDLFIMIEQAVGHINGGRETKAFKLYSQSFTQLLAEFKVK